MKVIEEGLSAQLEEVNNKMGQVGFLFNYLLFIIGINFKVKRLCQSLPRCHQKRAEEEISYLFICRMTL